MSEDKKFRLVAPYKPTGDQPKAIAHLLKGIEKNERHQVLLGATGTGKTFAMANIVAELQRPTLVLAHNKTLAAQLCSETKIFDPAMNRETWTNPGGRPNHLWDCEHQQVAAAWRLGLGAPEPEASEQPASGERVSSTEWLGRGRGKW